MIQGRFGKLDPTPNALMNAILRTPWAAMAFEMFAMESAIIRGGDMGFAKGISEARRAFKVIITASMGVWEKAVEMSVGFKGEPPRRVTP